MWVCFGSFFILLKFWQIYAAYFLGEGEPFLAPGGLLKILFLAGGRGYHRSPLHWEPVAWGEYDFVYSIFSLYRRWERWWPWIGEPSVKLSVGILNWCDLSKFLCFVKFSVSWLRKSLFQFNFCVGPEAWIYLNCFPVYVWDWLILWIPYFLLASGDCTSGPWRVLHLCLLL